MARPLKVGLMLIPYEDAMEGGTARWSDLREMAVLAEEVGFDSLWLPDHLLRRVGDDTRGVWECCSLLAALAASTTKVELGTVVISTTFRNPALLAKMADTIDEISGGRLTLGIGAGWNDPEHIAFGYPTDYRYSRFAEALQIIHGLLKDGQIDFEGEYYSARECELRPCGPRPQGPPIMIGTQGPRMLRLCARYADIWNGMPVTSGPQNPDVVARLRERVDEACRDTGRDPETLARYLAVLVAPTGEDDPFFSGAISGSPDEVASALSAYADEGISHLQVIVSPNSLTGVEAMAPILEALDRA